VLKSFKIQGWGHGSVVECLAGNPVPRFQPQHQERKGRKGRKRRDRGRERCRVRGRDRGN
jgi:hypothetical protein